MFLRENDMMTQTLSLFLVGSLNKHKIESGRGVSFFFFSLATRSPWLSLSPSKTEKKAEERTHRVCLVCCLFGMLSLPNSLPLQTLSPPLYQEKSRARALSLSSGAGYVCKNSGMGGQRKKEYIQFFCSLFSLAVSFAAPSSSFSPPPLSLSELSQPTHSFSHSAIAM